MSEKVIYIWEIPDDYPNFSGHDDIPEAYRVIENEEATAGVIVESRIRGKWGANPWNTRTLVRHLLSELNRSRAQDFTMEDISGLSESEMYGD